MKMVPNGMKGKPSAHKKVKSGGKFVDGKGGAMKRGSAMKPAQSKAHLYDSMAPRGK